VFETPESRAELEARLRQVTSQIGDESVRRHYQQDMRERMQAFFGVAATVTGNAMARAATAISAAAAGVADPSAVLAAGAAVRNPSAVFGAGWRSRNGWRVPVWCAGMATRRH
jgi:DNA primase